MTKIYKIVGLLTQTLAVLLWFGTLALHGTNSNLMEALAIMIAILASVMLIAYWVLASGDYDRFASLFLDHPHAWVLAAVGITWLVPAILVDPWYSFAAVTLFVCCMWAAGWSEEKYLETLRKAQRDLDDYPPF